jgi:ABC-type sugar transport system permease subunit
VPSGLDMPAPAGAAPAGGLPARSLRRRLGASATPLLLLLPAALLIGWLLAYPLGEVIRLSLSDWNGFSPPHWIGLENFKSLTEDPQFKEAVVHNLLILLAMPIWILIPYGVAWGLFSQIWGWRFFRFAFFIPVVLAPAVVGVAFGIILHPTGPFNEVLRAVGLNGVARAWLNEPGLALPIVIAVMIWSTFGIGTMIFLAALSNLDQEQIDAARVDGATPMQVQRHVLFWQLLPVIEFWAILILIISFTAFLPLIFALTHGGPGTSTYTIDFSLYVQAFRTGALGYASAIGVAMLIVMGVLGGAIIGALRWRRR